MSARAEGKERRTMGEQKSAPREKKGRGALAQKSRAKEGQESAPACENYARANVRLKRLQLVGDWRANISFPAFVRGPLQSSR